MYGNANDERELLEVGWRAAGASDDLENVNRDLYPERVLAGWDGLETDHRCRHCGLVGGH